MGILPDLDPEVARADDHIECIVNDGLLNGLVYTSLTLHNEHFLLAPDELGTEPFLLSYTSFYPTRSKDQDGYLISEITPNCSVLEIAPTLELNKVEVAADAAFNSAARQRRAVAASRLGGLLAEIEGICEKAEIPLGSIVLWSRSTEVELPVLATLHSIAAVPPQTVLGAIKMAILEGQSSDGRL